MCVSKPLNCIILTVNILYKPIYLSHEVRGEVDVREAARLVEVEAGALQCAEGVGGAVAKTDGVAIRLIRVPVNRLF